MAKYDLNKWTYIEDEDRWMSPKVRLTFVAVAKKFKAKDAKPDDDGSYCATFIDRPSTDKTAVKKAITKLSKETFKDKKGNPIDVLDPDKRGKIRTPFLDAEQELSDITSKGEPVDLEGWNMVRPNAYSRRPVVKNSQGEVLDLDDIQTEVYSGRWARLILQMKEYNRPDNKGIKFYVDCIQLLSNDDNIGGGGGSKGEAFEAVDDEDEDGGEDALD